jgi:endonuclease YncB( thermonuclease family)
MFLRARLWSGHRQGVALPIAAATFVLGLAVGSAVGPVMASREGGQPIATIVPGNATSIRAAPGVHPAKVLRVLDGDTFEARVHLWPGLDITTRVRLRGIDAPEMKARCGEERARAEAAREALRAILDQGEVAIGRVTLDKYGGRVVADASTGATVDVATALLGAGLVRRYDGGRRDGWC